MMDFGIYFVIPQKVTHLAKILIRTKFIVHKIFFRILSSSKTSWMFFGLPWKFCENPFVGVHGHFDGKVASGDKNQYNLFCRKWGFEYFSFNNFFKKRKNNIIQNNSEKKCLGVWLFFREQGVERQKWI